MVLGVFEMSAVWADKLLQSQRLAEMVLKPPFPETMYVKGFLVTEDFSEFARLSISM